MFILIWQKIKPAYQSQIVRIQKRPLASFFVTLAILFIAILISKTLFTPKSTSTKTIALPKPVQIYQVSSIPKITVQGQIKKTGVIKILSQTSGIVQNLFFKEGDQVARGANLITISSNYQGDNAANIQTAIATRQYQQITDTFQTQVDLINRQRDLVNTAHDNSQNLATISAQSVGETQNLINLNQDILNSLNTNLSNLENNNPGGVNDAAILQIKVQISQLEAGQNQLLSAERNLTFSTNTANSPLQLSDIQRDIALKQLDLQQKGLEMNRDVTKLQVALAAIMASFFHPSAPISGTVERVFVNPLQIINPGTPLLTIVGESKDLQLTITLPPDEALKLSRIEPATIHFKNKIDSLTPSFISSEATDNQLYSLIFNLPPEDYDQVSDGDFVTVDLPIGNSSTLGTYYLPLDAVVQTRDQSQVYFNDKGSVATRKIVLGSVSGQFVQVTSGLTGSEQIILNRNVVVGDKVQAL